MRQQSLFDIDSVSCKHCGCFLSTLAELRERCTENDTGAHEVMPHQYFVLAGKSDSAVAVAK